MAEKNTRIGYFYRCASNWKYWGSFNVRGKLTSHELAPYLFDGSFFVPEQVGLHHLLTDPWTKDDHLLHSLFSFDQTEETDCICTANQLIKKFAAANSLGWFEGY